MWNAHLANLSLIQSLLCDDHATAKAALAAGASAMLSLPRQSTSLLQCAIRLHSVTFVDLLMSHGAVAGPAELDTLVEQVRASTGQTDFTARRVRAVAACLHNHRTDFDSHIDALCALQPAWFKGLQEHCHAARPVPGVDRPVPKIRRRAPGVA